MHLLAAEGGYQEFTLGSAEWFWLVFAAVTALVALGSWFAADAWRSGCGPGNPKDDRDREGDSGGSPRVPHVVR